MGALSAGLGIAALVAVVLALVVTHGLADVTLLVLAVGLLVASYAVRQWARDQLVYRRRDDLS